MSPSSSGRSKPDTEMPPSSRMRYRATSHILLVVDLADNLLDEVLQRHDPGRAAVLVNDDGDLQAGLAQLLRRGSKVIDSGTNTGGTAISRTLRSGRSARHSQGVLLKCTSPTTSSTDSPSTGKRSGRWCGHVDEVLHAVVAHKDDPRSGAHDIGSRALAELDGARHQMHGFAVKGCLRRRIAPRAPELLGGPSIRPSSVGVNPSRFRTSWPRNSGSKRASRKEP